MEPQKGEPVLLVDDILRSGRTLSELKTLLESYGAVVVALGSIVSQPTPHTKDFGALPQLHLASLQAGYFADAASCDLCTKSLPVENVRL
jgi:adenine/guanine phosphoribosyltransferase-like PRPP-binding protein